MEVFINELQAISLVQWLSSLFALIYIYFAYKNQSFCFLFGFISALLWAYESYYNLNLKFDAGLQIFYAAMSIYGIYIWKYGGDNNTSKPISFLSLKNNLFWIVGGFVVILGLYYWATQNVDTSRPFIDIFTTVYSIIGTVLLVYRKIESWVIFIVSDLLYAYIYYVQGGIVFTLIMVLYTVIAIASWFHWKKLSQLETQNQFI